MGARSVRNRDMIPILDEGSGSRSRAGACQGVRISAGGSGPRGRYQALTGAGGLLTPHAVAIAPS